MSLFPDLGSPDTASNPCHSTRFSLVRQVPMFHVKHRPRDLRRNVSRETISRSESVTLKVLAPSGWRCHLVADSAMFHVKHQNKGLFFGVPETRGYSWCRRMLFYEDLVRRTVANPTLATRPKRIKPLHSSVVRRIVRRFRNDQDSPDLEESARHTPPLPPADQRSVR